MERRVVKHGPATFMVSLPKSWVTKHSIKKGDSIHYTLQEENIIYSAKDVVPEISEIDVDFSDLDRSSIMFFLRALYRKGYTVIKIRYKDQIIQYHAKDKEERISSVIMEEARRLIGLELSEQRRNLIVLRQMAEPTDEELKQSVRRVFFLYKTAFEDMISSIEAKDMDSLLSIEERHDSITKLISFCIRILHRKRDNSKYLVHVLMTFDVMIDMLKYLFTDVNKNKIVIDKDALIGLKQFYELHCIFDKLFFDFDNKLSNQFNELRTKIKKNFTKKTTLFYLMPLLEIERDLIEAKLCMD